MDILALSRRIPLLGFFGSSASDDDFADRLNYKYTVAILVVFAFIVTNKHFGHNQINCWVPALFSKNFEEYTNLVCWITNTYYIPFDKQIPTTEAERRSSELRYYQWVAYILLILALLFYLPRIIWRTLSLRSGIDIKDVIEASHDFKSVSKLEKNRKMMEYMIGTIDQYVDDPRRQRSNRHMGWLRRTAALTCFMFGKFLGNYLVVLYLFVKVLYIVNCVGQLFLISILLGRNFYIYGASIFRDIIQGRGYADSEYFPRVTMCKFQVRELGLKNFSHEYNVQCVLPINLFNQQIFTFLWFWYIILLIINSSALLIWVYRFIPMNQYNYAIRRIKMLRIRLMENSKARAAAQNMNRTSSFNSRRSTTTKSRSMRIREIIEYEQNQHQQQQQQRRLSTVPNTPTTPRSTANSEFDQPRMFPNIPPHYNIEFTGYGSGAASNCEVRLRHEKNVMTTVTNSSSANASSSDYFDSDPLMSASSFTVKNYKAFVHDYLESDGMFMLRMIGSNSGDFVCTQVLHNLWKLFLCKKCILPRAKVKGSGPSLSAAQTDDESTSHQRKRTASGGGVGSSATQPSVFNFDVHTSEFDEEDDDDVKKTKIKTKAKLKPPAPSAFETRRMAAVKKASKPSTIKSVMTRKKSSLIGRLFSEVSQPKASISKTSALSSLAPLKSRSVHLLSQQKKQTAKQHQPQARDERFSMEMKRFQSIKRISRPQNRLLQPPSPSRRTLSPNDFIEE